MNCLYPDMGSSRFINLRVGVTVDTSIFVLLYTPVSKALSPAVRFKLTTIGLRIPDLMCHLMTPDSITSYVVWYQALFCIQIYHPVPLGYKQFVGEIQ